MPWILIILGTIILDRITKVITIKGMELSQSIKVIENFFYITYWENKGAAWGMFQNGRYIFITITIVVTAVLIYLLFRSRNKLFSTAVSLIIGGAIGNLVDRIFRGSVTDFFDFRIFGYEFPIFNFADIFVVIGTGLLAIYLLFVYEE